MTDEPMTSPAREVLAALTVGPVDVAQIVDRVASVPPDVVESALDVLVSRGLVARHHVQTLPPRVVFRRV